MHRNDPHTRRYMEVPKNRRWKPLRQNNTEKTAYTSQSLCKAFANAFVVYSYWLLLTQPCGSLTCSIADSLVPRPSSGSSTRCNNKGCNWGGAKSGSKERGPGAWAYPKLVPYTSIPVYEECLITDHKNVIAILHLTAHSAIYLLT